VPDYRFRDYWRHQLRWARNVKDRRGAQYFGLIVTFALAWSVFGVLTEPHAWWTWPTLIITLTVRLMSAAIVGRGVLQDPQVLRDLWLVPVRDIVALAVWIVSYAGNEIEWRGLRFQLHDGKLTRIGTT